MRILAGVLEGMRAHARGEAPRECCGLLLERNGTIVEAIRTRNLRAGETAYLIDPEAHFAAIRRARHEGCRLAGAYHSHPRSPAIPSPTDLAEAHDPDLVYVIVSLQEDGTDVRAWRLRDGAAAAVPLEVVDA